MACKADVTDKAKDNKVASEELALNIKRIRELTRDLKAATDCEQIKIYIELLGQEIKELTADIRKESKKILDKYLPLLNIPLNPLKIIGWVKKLVTNTIMPQLEAYIKLLKQIIELIQAINDFIQAVEEVIPKLKQCAVDAVEGELDDLRNEFNEIKGAIQAEVAKIAREISSEVNKLICESGIADLVNTVNDAVKLTNDLIDEIKTTKDLVSSGVNDALTSIGAIGSGVSNITGVPFEVNTSSPAAFVASVNAGKADEFSAGVAAFVAIPAPDNTVAPTLSGNAVVGQTLTANVGTWTGNNITYTYSWYKNNEPIYGANSSTYVLTANDAGYAILCSVSGDNAAGGDSVNTAFTSNVVSNAPVCSALPAITGTANVGEVLTVSTGTWTNSPTFAYQWQWAHVRLNIHNANTNTYTIGSEDIGQTLTCMVTATSSGGSNSVHAVATSVIGSATPGGGSTIFEVDTFTGNSSNTIFTLSFESTTNNAIVSINGAVQKPTSDYTVVAQALTFTEAPVTDDEIVVRYLAI